MQALSPKNSKFNPTNNVVVASRANVALRRTDSASFACRRAGCSSYKMPGPRRNPPTGSRAGLRPLPIRQTPRMDRAPASLGGRLAAATPRRWVAAFRWVVTLCVRRRYSANNHTCHAYRVHTPARANAPRTLSACSGRLSLSPFLLVARSCIRGWCIRAATSGAVSPSPSGSPPRKWP